MFKREEFEESIFGFYGITLYDNRQVLEYFLGGEFKLDIPEVKYNVLNDLYHDKNNACLISGNKKAIVYPRKEAREFDFSIHESEQNGYRICKLVHVMNGGDGKFPTIQIIEYDEDSIFVCDMHYEQQNLFGIAKYKIIIIVKYYNKDTVEIFEENSRSFKTYNNLTSLKIMPDDSISAGHEVNHISITDNLNVLYAVKKVLKDNTMSKRMVKESENN